MTDVEHTADGHYVVIHGRRWRATDPAIPEERAAELRSILMAWRRAVRDDPDVARARAGVHAAKLALGERGTPWWEETMAQRRRRWESLVPRPHEST